MSQSLRRRLREGEDGFTLIELMVVVLIIAVLLAIAIPTFLGARERAQDRAAQSNIRNTFTSEKVFYTDNQSYTTDSAGAITAIDASLTYGPPAAPSVVGIVYIETGSTLAPDDTLFVGAKSGTGRCYYLRDVAAAAVYGTAASGSCVLPSTATYTSGW